MTESKVTLVEPDSPDRCQSGHVKGQCRYAKMPGSNYCAMHGGNKAGELLRAKAKRQYQLAKWQSSVDGFADEEEAKSLRGEIGITRLLLQETVGRCKDSGELMLYSGKISDLVAKIERLVVSCNRLESHLGLVLDKGKVMELATQVVEIISKYVTDESAIESIAEEVANVIVQTQGNTEK